MVSETTGQVIKRRPVERGGAKMKQAENNPVEHGARGSKRKKRSTAYSQNTDLPEEEGGKCKQALASINTLHGLLRDLHLEMKTFEYPLPLDEVKVRADEVKDEEGLSKLIMKERDSLYINYAQLLDVILNTTKRISMDVERGVPKEALDGTLYTLRGYLSELMVMSSKASAVNVSLVNTNIDWLSENNYSQLYDLIEAIYPFIHDKIGIFHSASGALTCIERGESSCGFAFDEQQKKAFQKASRMISHVEDLLSCIVNVAINIDEEINCLVERYLKPGRTLSEEDKKTVQDVRKMLREMTDIEDSLLQGMSVNEAATKGQILGLVVFFCSREIVLVMYREFFVTSNIFKEYDGTDGPVLSPLQSASCYLQYMAVCNQVRREHLLEQTARSMDETRGTENKEEGEEKTSNY